MTIKGTRNDDDLSGTVGNDVFTLFQGGNDKADGGAGNDRFEMRGALNALDNIVGGDGHDRVLLEGDYSAGLAFAAATIKSIEAMQFSGDYDYDLTLRDGNVAAGRLLRVDASTISGGHHLFFDGSAERDGRFEFYGSAGDDMLTGGAGNDLFSFVLGGNDTAHGGGGKDTFIRWSSGTLTLDGGGGSDTLIDYVGGLTDTFTGIEKYVLLGSAGSAMVLSDASVPAGRTFTFDASGLSNADPDIGRLSLDASAETDGFIHFIGSSGNDLFDGFGPGDTFFAGTGTNDRAFLQGISGSFTIGAANMSGVELVGVHGSGTGFSLIMEDGAVSSGASLVVSIDPASTAAISFDGSAEADGKFQIRQSTPFADTFSLSDGGDTLLYLAAGSSTGPSTLDRITNFNADEDKFVFGVGQTVSVFDGVFSAASVTAANFDLSMNHTPSGGGSQYQAAWIIHATSGDAAYAGHYFLVVAVNGFTYATGHDFVFDVTGYSGTFDVGDFTTI